MISFGVKRMSSDLDKLIKRRFMMGFLFKKKWFLSTMKDQQGRVQW